MGKEKSETNHEGVTVMRYIPKVGDFVCESRRPAHWPTPGFGKVVVVTPDLTIVEVRSRSPILEGEYMFVKDPSDIMFIGLDEQAAEREHDVLDVAERFGYENVSPYGVTVKEFLCAIRTLLQMSKFNGRQP